MRSELCFFFVLPFVFILSSFQLHSVSFECVQIQSLAPIHMFHRTFPSHRLAHHTQTQWETEMRIHTGTDGKRLCDPRPEAHTLWMCIYISIKNLSGTADYILTFAYLLTLSVLSVPFSRTIYLVILCRDFQFCSSFGPIVPSSIAELAHSVSRSSRSRSLSLYVSACTYLSPSEVCYVAHLVFALCQGDSCCRDRGF